MNERKDADLVTLSPARLQQIQQEKGAQKSAEQEHQRHIRFFRHDSAPFLRR